MAQITYTDKDKTASDGVANKWRDVDANEVKTAVNANAALTTAAQSAADTAQTTANAALPKANAATALVDGAAIDLAAIKHTLASALAAITFTISHTGDDITLEVTLTNTAAVYTFPATALCVSEGTASGDNTLSLSGVSGDKYIIGIKKIGSAYYVASKNFGQ